MSSASIYQSPCSTSRAKKAATADYCAPTSPTRTCCRPPRYAIVCVGTLTPNHVEDGATLRAWLGWLRPGGIFCASIRDDFWSAGAIAGACRRLEEEGTWSLLEETSSRPYTPLVNDVAFAVRTWRVT